MQRLANWVVAFVVLAGLIAIGISFYQKVWLRDFTIQTEAVCNPAQEKCFVRDCDPKYERCNLGNDKLVYKLVTKPARDLPECDPFYGQCDQFLTCDPGKKDCKVTYCNPNNLADDQACFNN